ncbi:hypothetical protein Ahy_A04g017935 [Arachis hypogaea]|uniref:Uncharacterized protein n=1 Tax=Arachis hypogaea TaxID=3818 RepID=A0A445DCG2_ARAHY|nr:hypothetical protein Ahy_A04g017935 [Arachis hypogaea]
MCVADNTNQAALGVSESLSDIVSDIGKEVRRVRGVHPCLAPTMSQDHRQFDRSLIYCVILPLIQSNPSVRIATLQGAVRQNYHFKPSYRKVWMAKQKVIAQIYGDWEELYRSPTLLPPSATEDTYPKIRTLTEECIPRCLWCGGGLHDKGNGTSMPALPNPKTRNGTSRNHLGEGATGDAPCCSTYQ